MYTPTTNSLGIYFNKQIENEMDVSYFILENGYILI